MPKRLKVEFTADWSPEKRRMVSSRLRQDLAMYGGVSYVSDVVPAEEQLEEGPRMIKLQCNYNAFGNKCGAQWESPQFTDCPNGHGRKFVHRREEIPQVMPPEVKAN